jgi:phage terminase large subunit GpA-like protein
VEWKKTTERNEPFDLKVYNRAAASIYGIDRFNEQQWQQLEAVVAAVELTATPVIPAPAQRATSSGSWFGQQSGSWFGGVR